MSRSPSWLHQRKRGARAQSCDTESTENRLRPKPSRSWKCVSGAPRKGRKAGGKPRALYTNHWTDCGPLHYCFPFRFMYRCYEHMLLANYRHSCGLWGFSARGISTAMFLYNKIILFYQNQAPHSPQNSQRRDREVARSGAAAHWWVPPPQSPPVWFI